MEKYLNMPIKEIITKFPKVADILNEYKIGCAPCNVGSCLLKDVVEVHNLSAESEEELMVKIAGIIYPGESVNIPRLKRVIKPKSDKLNYSPPIKKLVDEHALIKRWIALIPDVIEGLDLSSPRDRQIISDGVDFIRSYADKYHHAKEEEILFKYFDENLDIVKTMLEDHTTGRNHVKAIVEALERKDKKAIVEHLAGYKDLLTEHVKREDEILYPWMDRSFSVSQVGELFDKFNAADEKTGEVVPKRCERFVKELEKRLKKEKDGVPRRLC